jgi:hypothetical protein
MNCARIVLATSLALTAAAARTPAGKRPWIETRGIYGGVPAELMQSGKPLGDSGVNAVFMGAGSLTPERVRELRAAGARVYAEFNSMHHEAYVKDHLDSAPVETDGKPSPPPGGWQGACPTHPGYRRDRMGAFQAALASLDLDGIWLDYHHGHANWEQAVPALPDTCFCPRCLAQFQSDTGVRLPEAPVSELSRLLLGKHRGRWVDWRCGVFTDWVREYRAIVDATRPGALLGTFHCPWTENEFDGALRRVLAIDLKAQARYIHVFSPMPYHARFGHVSDPAWISRQVGWLGRHLGVRGAPRERVKIWPIVQLSDWGESVLADQVATVLDQGTLAPATGIIVFAWGSLRKQADKVEELTRFYRSIR